METEYLFYFPPAETEAGTMPGYYDLLSGWNVAEARKWGGRDVSHDQRAWAEYNRRREAENASYL